MPNMLSKEDKVFEVAKYFIYRSQQEKKEITNKKLQKLLYYAQAWSLVLKKDRLFSDKFQAWIHGPAIPRVYFEFKQFGFGNINVKIDYKTIKLDDEEKELLDNIWKIYGKNYTASYLEALTHSEEPWQEAREGIEDYEASDKEISEATMKDYYGQKIQKEK